MTAFIALIGVIIGAGLQYLLSRSTERQKHFAALKTQAYVDYLKSVSKLAHGRTFDTNLMLLTEAADAKTRICIYGSGAVISLLAEFERQGAKLTSKDSFSIFVRLCSQIRLEGLQKDSIPNEDIETVLFGSSTHS